MFQPDVIIFMFLHLRLVSLLATTKSDFSKVILAFGVKMPDLK